MRRFLSDRSRNDSSPIRTSSGIEDLRLVQHRFPQRLYGNRFSVDVFRALLCAARGNPEQESAIRADVENAF